MSTTRKRGVDAPDADDDASPAAPAKRAKGVLDDVLAHALRTSTEAFVAADPESFDTLSEEQIDAALACARGNPALEKLGLDGTGCPLRVAPARELGALGVRELKFVGLAFAEEDARAAFADAVGRNGALASLAVFETNADGEWARFAPDTSKFAADLQARRAKHALPPLLIEQIDDGEGEDEEADAVDEDGESEEEEDGEDYVLCDGRIGPRRGGEPCGKRLVSDDVVFTSAFGQDYCAACHERLGRSQPLRRLTAAERMKEEVI